jgi:excisionase family DNA binding protein
MENEKTLHTVEAVANRIQYHPVTVRKAIRAGRIEAIKFGKSWRIPDSVLEKICREGLPMVQEVA